MAHFSKANASLNAFASRYALCQGETLADGCGEPEGMADI